MTHEDAIAAILAREQEKGVVTEAELRQQLADVTNERDSAKKDRFAALIQLKASEARNAELKQLLGLAWGDGDVSAAECRKIDAALAQSAPVTANQCDGCQAGKPLENGNRHRMGREGGYPDLMSCTAKLYAPATDEQGAKADHGLLQGIVDLKDMKP